MESQRRYIERAGKIYLLYNSTEYRLTSDAEKELRARLKRQQTEAEKALTRVMIAQVRTELDALSTGQESYSDAVSCPLCNQVTRRDKVGNHIIIAHRLDDITQVERLEAINQIASLLAVKIKQQEQVPLPQHFIYEASAEFVSDYLHSADTQRHDRDNISPRAQSEQYTVSFERMLLEYELAKAKEAEQERKREERIALVAAKQTQGLAEVVVGCVVTVYDVEAKEATSYYMASAEQEYHHKQRIYVDRHDVPPGGADECLYADCDLYKALLGSFVDDEVQAQVPVGILTFRVLSVKSCNVAESGLRVEMSVRNDNVSQIQPHARIGSEAWTFVARDGGQFGSISRHDDYSDESDAEVNDNDWVDEYEE